MHFVIGITTCLNNQDCVGANRHCHRNQSLIEGICVCDDGYKRAVKDSIRCLKISKLINILFGDTL